MTFSHTSGPEIYNLWDVYQVVNPSPVSDSDAETIYQKLSALVPAIETGLGALQAKKPAVMELVPQLLTVLGHPRDVVYDNLGSVKISFIRLRLALTAAAPVSRFTNLSCAVALRIS